MFCIDRIHMEWLNAHFKAKAGFKKLFRLAIHVADCKACDYARNNNIPVIEYPKRKAAENEKFPTELVASLRYNARFVYFLIFNRGFFLCNWSSILSFSWVRIMTCFKGSSFLQPLWNIALNMSILHRGLWMVYDW